MKVKQLLKAFEILEFELFQKLFPILGHNFILFLDATFSTFPTL